MADRHEAGGESHPPNLGQATMADLTACPSRSCGSSRLQWSPQPEPEFGTAALRLCSQDRQQQHGAKNSQQTGRSGANGGCTFGQDGKAAVDEFHVHPVHQQRSLTQLDQGTEAPASKTPAAPGITNQQDQQQKSYTNQEEVGAGVPEVVDRIEVLRLRIPPAGEHNQQKACCPQQREGVSLAHAHPVAHKNKANG